MRLRYRVRLILWQLLRPKYVSKRAYYAEITANLILRRTQVQKQIIDKLKRAYIAGDIKTIDECWMCIQ